MLFKSQIRKITKSYYFNRALLIGLSDSIVKGGIFILNLLLAKLLISDEYGLYSLYFATINLISILYTFGISNYLSKKISIINDNHKYYFINSISIFLFVSIIISSIFLVIFKNSSYINYFTIFGGLTWAFIQIQKSYLQARNHIKFFFIYDFFKIILPCTIILYLLYSKHIITLTNVTSAFTLSFIIFFIIIVSKISKNYKLINKDTAIQIFKSSIPLMPYMALMWVINVSDRYVIEILTDLTSVGVYSLIYSLASIYALGTGFINAIYINKMFRDLSASKKIFRKYFISLTAIYLCIGVLSTIISLTLNSWLEYNVSIDILIIILVGFFFNALHTIVGNYIFFLNKIKFLVTSSLIGAMLNITLNFILIPIMGLHGAAYGTLIAYLSMFLYSLFKIKKYNEPI